MCVLTTSLPLQQTRRGKQVAASLCRRLKKIDAKINEQLSNEVRMNFATSLFSFCMRSAVCSMARFSVSIYCRFVWPLVVCLFAFVICCSLRFRRRRRQLPTRDHSPCSDWYTVRSRPVTGLLFARWRDGLADRSATRRGATTANDMRLPVHAQQTIT